MLKRLTNSQEEAAPGRWATLIPMSEPLKPVELCGNQQFVLGRYENCDYVVNENSWPGKGREDGRTDFGIISKRHFVISRDNKNGEGIIEDCEFFVRLV